MNEALMEPERKPSFGQAIFLMTGHILGSAALFLVVACAAWGLGLAVHVLDAKHPFPERALSLLHSVELWLLYIDVALSGVVLLVGAIRFLMDLGGKR